MAKRRPLLSVARPSVAVDARSAPSAALQRQRAGTPALPRSGAEARLDAASHGGSVRTSVQRARPKDAARVRIDTGAAPTENRTNRSGWSIGPRNRVPSAPARQASPSRAQHRRGSSVAVPSTSGARRAAATKRRPPEPRVISPRRSRVLPRTTRRACSRRSDPSPGSRAGASRGVRRGCAADSPAARAARRRRRRRG